MNCRTARRRIGARHDEGLGRDLEDALAAHLRSCSGCSRLAGETDRLDTWLRELPDVEPSANFDWRLRLRLSKLERERDARLFVEGPLQAPRHARLQFAVSAAAAAVAVVALGLGLFQMRNSRGPGEKRAESTSAPAGLVLVRPDPVAPVPRPDLGWPRPVPVRAGAPLGPEAAFPAPSILGEPGPDSLRSQWEQSAPSRPVRVTSPTYVGNPGPQQVP